MSQFSSSLPLPPLCLLSTFPFPTECAICGVWGPTGDQVEANRQLCASKEKVSCHHLDTGDDILQGECVLYN